MFYLKVSLGHMKKRCLYVIIVVVALFYTFNPAIFHVNAARVRTEQPEACAWPSETMSKYFQFQEDMIHVLLWSSINEKRFSTAMWNWWLFVNQVLYLSGTTSALDLVSSSVLGWVKSLFSATTTTLVLLLLTSASTFQSNASSFLILFKDRPIVRDYKRMLDIESELFDVAYFRSKQVDLTRSFDWDLLNQFSEVIKQYQDNWLLSYTWTTQISNTASMSDILWDLVHMNAAMKWFMLDWSTVWGERIRSYRWCMWERNDNADCIPVLKFSDETLINLRKEYDGIWMYWSCNRIASNIKRASQKNKENTKGSSETAEEKIERWEKELKDLYAGNTNNGSKEKKKINRCKMSDYQMAQLKAYWWDDWTCEEWESWVWWWVDLKFSAPMDYNELKSVAIWMKDGAVSVVKASVGATKQFITKIKTNLDKFDNSKTTREKEQVFFELYGSWYTYSPEFKEDFRDSLVSIYSDTMTDYAQSQANAVAWDFSYQLIKIKWLLDEVDSVMSWSDGLQEYLEKIANFQCSNS